MASAVSCASPVIIAILTPLAISSSIESLRQSSAATWGRCANTTPARGGSTIDTSPINVRLLMSCAAVSAISWVIVDAHSSGRKGEHALALERELARHAEDLGAVDGGDGDAFAVAALKQLAPLDQRIRRALLESAAMRQCGRRALT